MKVLAIIPARMGSSRFPGKPMENILGVPMIEIIYKKVIECKLVEKTIVATCDEVIFNHIKDIGGNAIMTSSSHQRASDRCSEAVDILENDRKEKYDVILMVQGDEPLITSKMIEDALLPLIKDKTINVVNLLGLIKDKQEFYDPNCIKVVCDENKNALYFSRQPIPNSNIQSFPFLGKQVCIIPFKREFLYIYNQLKPTICEKSESIDMLRVLEHGYSVKMVPTFEETQAVDTLEDLKKVEKILSI